MVAVLSFILEIFPVILSGKCYYQKAGYLTTICSGKVLCMEFWIIGYGRVGGRALERLQRKFPAAEFVIVDPRLEEAPEGMQNVRWRGQDGVTFLAAHRWQVTDVPSPWIVPALPRHLAFEWVAAQLKKTVEMVVTPVPDELVAQLPNTVVGAVGQVTISIADFICRPDCREPRWECPITGALRPFDLYRRLADIRMEGYRSVVVRSYQLAPGVGGFRGRQLEETLQIIRTRPGSILLSTASKCHGVLHGLSWRENNG